MRAIRSAVFSNRLTAGAAYIARGDTALAITNYEKVLTLDPGNANAKDILLKLRAATAPQ